jgi:hypothetical protein
MAIFGSTTDLLITKAGPEEQQQIPDTRCRRFTDRDETGENMVITLHWVFRFDSRPESSTARYETNVAGWPEVQAGANHPRVRYGSDSASDSDASFKKMKVLDAPLWISFPSNRLRSGEGH